MDVNKFIDELLGKDLGIWQQSDETAWRLPTGVISLDHLLGGGFPSGSVIQVHGPKSVGKTSLVLSTVAEAVKHELPTLYMAEEKWDTRYAKACGVDVDSPYFNQISAINMQVLSNTVVSAFMNTDLKVCVIDSIANANSREALEKKQPTSDMDKGPQIGARAKLITDFLSKVEQPLRRNGGILILTNQPRSQISAFVTYQAPSGGKALQHTVDVSLSLSNVSGASKEVGGSASSTITIDKSREYDVIYHATTIIDFRHREGIDKARNLIRYCEDADIVNRSGAWYNYKDQKFQGLSGFADAIRGNPELWKELESQTGVYDTLPPFPISNPIEEPKKGRKK